MLSSAFWIAASLSVQRGCGLIQDQDRRIFQYGARDANAPFLPAGELHPALPHMGVIGGATSIVDQIRDEVMRAGFWAAAITSSTVAFGLP